MNKILVIGSKGFIGSNLVNYLSSQEANEVWECDVINDYSSKKYFVIDASNSDFEEVFQTNQFDVCVNCSGAAIVHDSIIHPLRDFYLNTLNVFKLLEAIRKSTPGCRFVNISSAAVYGNPENLPIKELAPLQPLSPYGWHKLQAEKICEEFYQVYKIRTCTVRIFSAYGNGLKKQLFWDISQKISSNKKLFLLGTGNESRDFIHIVDIVKAIELVIKSDFHHKIYNVANGIEITIKDIAKKMEKAMGYKGNLKFSGIKREGDPINWRADISGIKSLGYKQEIDIDNGIEKYVAWLREEKFI